MGDGQIELYSHARYFTFTGRAFRSAPTEIEDHTGDFRRLYLHLTENHKRRWNCGPSPVDGFRTGDSTTR